MMGETIILCFHLQETETLNDFKHSISDNKKSGDRVTPVLVNSAAQDPSSF